MSFFNAIKYLSEVFPLGIRPGTLKGTNFTLASRISKSFTVSVGNTQILSMFFKSILLLGTTVLGLGLSMNAIASEPVGLVECASLDGSTRSDALFFAALSPNSDSEGFNLLIVEETGALVLSMDHHLVVQGASTIEGQQLLGWNLVAYDGEPLQISPDGTFSLSMMVSTRSTCRFEGTAIFLEGAEELLPNRDQ